MTNRGHAAEIPCAGMPPRLSCIQHERFKLEMFPQTAHAHKYSGGLPASAILCTRMETSNGDERLGEDSE
ncbi:hypothetical protein EIM92_11590 [Paenibacillus lentus]|uniref:Uncharacterized protein n=2 Tax=Paenibacillus lentus TaxID=1338368 RepID=A0A3Q8SB51_9BACL|nr:hypothetical protein EIM92_11590 [Paenibacillus lentus]